MKYLLGVNTNSKATITDEKFASIDADTKSSYEEFATESARDIEWAKRQKLIDAKKLFDEGKMGHLISTANDIIISYAGYKIALASNEPGGGLIHWKSVWDHSLLFKADLAMLSAGKPVTITPLEENGMIQILEDMKTLSPDIYQRLNKLIELDEVVEPTEWVAEWNKILNQIH